MPALPGQEGLSKLFCFLLLFFLTLSGCTTRSKAEAQAQATYSAGQQQALER